MAGKVTWAAVKGKHAYSVEDTVGPWDCVNERLDVMLVQFFLKRIFQGHGKSHYPLGKTIHVNGTYDGTTHYWTMMCMNNYMGHHGKGECKIHKIKALVSLGPGFLDNDNATEPMEVLNRQYAKHFELEFADLSKVNDVPTELRTRLKTYGFTL